MKRSFIEQLVTLTSYNTWIEFLKTKYKLSNINQIVHVSIYCMSVQKNKKYTLKEM